MVKKKRLRLKSSLLTFLKIFGFIIIVVVGVFIFYRVQIKTLTSIGYSEEASKVILFSMKKDYVLAMGENKTLNEAFESEDYKEEYLDNYSKIKYVNHKSLIKNINTLIKRGYSNNDINIIFAHGNNEDVEEFAKKDKVKYLEEFYSLDYAKLRYYDKYVEYSTTTGEDEETTVLYINLGMDKEEYVDPVVVTEYSHTILVNKYRKLEDNFQPYDLTTIPVEYASSDDMQASKMALDAFVEMYNAAKNEGYELVINSAFRSYQDQVDLINTYRNLYGENYVQRYVAYAGHSEHQTGLAFDIGSTTSNVFANSKEYPWVVENAHKYGFIIRFTTKGQSLTGFRNEPWHVRFVGKTASNYIYENGITFEEYYAKVLDVE